MLNMAHFFSVDSGLKEKYTGLLLSNACDNFCYYVTWILYYVFVHPQRHLIYFQLFFLLLLEIGTILKLLF